MFKSKTATVAQRAPRIMLIAGQNETVRKNSGQDGFVATVGLFECVALIIADSNGNVSLTHVDCDTDLSFIAKEVALMSGAFTINLVKGPGASALDLKVLSQLEKDGLAHIQFSGSSKVIKSPERTVLYNHLKGVLQFFSFIEFCELSSPGFDPGEGNKLFTLGYRVQNCEPDPLKFQLRIYIRQLNQALSSHRCVPPLLVHGGSGWMESTVHLEDDASVALHSAALAKPLTFFHSEKRRSFDYVYPRYMALLEKMALTDEKKPASVVPHKS